MRAVRVREVADARGVRAPVRAPDRAKADNETRAFVVSCARVRAARSEWMTEVAAAVSSSSGLAGKLDGELAPATDVAGGVRWQPPMAPRALRQRDPRPWPA